MEEKKLLENDILFQIDMQLYDEFNDEIATMRDYLGDIYSLRDIEEVEQAQKEREIELLRKAVITQQKEIEELKLKCEKLENKRKDPLNEAINSYLFSSLAEENEEE